MIFRNIPVLLIFFLPLLSLAAPSPERETALFAGGCFWCMQPPFDHWKNRGVISTKVGYTGGVLENPKYEQVSHEKTGHREAIEVVFNPRKVTYEELLELFWKQIDPFDSKGQFCDKGEQYTSADRKSTRLNSSHSQQSRMPSSA